MYTIVPAKQQRVKLCCPCIGFGSGIISVFSLLFNAFSGNFVLVTPYYDWRASLSCIHG